MISNEPLVSHCPEPFAPYCPACIATKKTESGCIALCDPMEGLQVEPSILHLHSQLIFDSNSPFYNMLGYKVVQTYRNSACLLSVGNVDPEHLGKNARLTIVSETAGIPLRVSIDAIIDVGDMLHLLSVFQLPGNTLLVTSFLYQDCLGYQLRVAIALNYIKGQMTYLFEPNAPSEGPVKETLSGDLPSGSFYCYRTMFFRGRRSQGVCRSS